MSAALGLRKLRGKERQCHGKKKRNDTPGHIGSQSLATVTSTQPRDVRQICPHRCSISAGAFSGGHASRGFTFKFKEGNIPCRGVPHTGHFSAFKVISAPQQAQYAAIGPSKLSACLTR